MTRGSKRGGCCTATAYIAMLTQPTRPLVVIDLNVFRSWPHTYFPPGHDVVFPTVILDEIADNPNEGYSKKLVKFVITHINQVWFGREFIDLISMERSPRRRLGCLDFIDLPTTRLLRKQVAQNPEYLLTRYLECRQLPEIRNGYDQNRRIFGNNCENFASNALLHRSEWQKEIANNFEHPELVEFFRCPNAILKGATLWGTKYATPQWRQVLDAFPDVKAIGRWTRIELWYYIRRTAGFAPDANRWDDAHYAFLGSYVGKLATADLELTLLMQQIFPYCNIVTNV